MAQYSGRKLGHYLDDNCLVNRIPKTYFLNWFIVLTGLGLLYIYLLTVLIIIWVSLCQQKSQQFWSSAFYNGLFKKEIVPPPPVEDIDIFEVYPLDIPCFFLNFWCIPPEIPMNFTLPPPLNFPLISFHINKGVTIFFCKSPILSIIMNVIFCYYSYFRNVLMSSGESQTTIASELAICESEIDESVLTPINKLLEVNYLLKLRFMILGFFAQKVAKFVKT